MSKPLRIIFLIGGFGLLASAIVYLLFCKPDEPKEKKWTENMSKECVAKGGVGLGNAYRKFCLQTIPLHDDTGIEKSTQ